jgi:release factor glutamine methyltransferase
MQKGVPGGWLLVEIGCRQSEAVRQLFAEAGLSEIFVRNDYADRPRVVGGRYHEGKSEPWKK